MRWTAFIIVGLLLLVGCSRPANVQNDNTQSRTKTENDEKFGLTKRTRMAIFKEIDKLHFSVRSIAQDKYPIRDRNLVYHNYELYRSILRKQKELEEIIIAEPQKKLAEKHGITVEILDSIYQEGTESLWNLHMPTPEDIY